MRLLRVDEAAQMLGIKESTIRRMILERRIAYVKIGRSVRIPENTLVKMISDGTIRPIVRA